jgi:branched-chain amino acid transport system substrate-binding protein
LLACPLLLAGCLGGASDRDEPLRGNRLAIYSSLPMHGVAAGAGQAVAAGQRLALAGARGRVGRYRIRLVPLNSSLPAAGPWDPGLVNANAGRAAHDPSAIAYLGELDYGGSAVSVPITNAARLVQISPGDGLASLTRTPPGEQQRGGPLRYYPSGRRSFLRLVPDDVRAARAVLALGDVARARRIAVVTDDGNYGEELGRTVVQLALRRHQIVVREEDFNGRPDAALSVAATIAQRRPDVVVYTGVVAPGTAGLLAALDRALPRRPVLGAAGLSPDASRGAPSPGMRVVVVSPFLPSSAYPARARRLLRALPAGVRRAEALYGYESTRLVLDAVRSVTARGRSPTRAAVMRAVLATRLRRAAIGRYRIERSGDVTNSAFAEYRVSRGRLLFERLLR